MQKRSKGNKESMGLVGWCEKKGDHQLAEKERKEGAAVGAAME